MDSALPVAVTHVNGVLHMYLRTSRQLRLWRVRLRRPAVLHPLDRLAEGVAGLLGFADVADQLLLELVAVLHVRSRAQLHDEVRQRLLGSLVRRMGKHVIRRGTPG